MIILEKLSKNSNKIKILIIGPYPPPYGGIAVVVRDLLESPLVEEFNMKLLKKSPKEKFKIMYLGEILRVCDDILSLLIQLIKFKPDIVHINSSYDWGWPKHVIYAIIAKSFRTKVILHLHAYHRRCNDDFPNCWLRRFIFPPKEVFKLVDTIFTLSDKYTNKIRKLGINTQVVTIHNGIILKKFSDLIDKEKINDKFVITFIGTLEKRKGIYELIAAADQLSNKLLDFDLFIAGDGPARNDLERWLLSNTCQNVHYLGRISEDEKIHILKITDVFILQSTNEGVPIALLEAIASGCAIITSPVGDIPTIIKNEHNGILIPPQNVSALVESINMLYNNRTILKNFQSFNLKNRSYHSWENISTEISDTYNRLCGVTK